LWTPVWGSVFAHCHTTGRGERGLGKSAKNQGITNTARGSTRKHARIYSWILGGVGGGVFWRSVTVDKKIYPYGASAGTPPRNEKMYGIHGKPRANVAQTLFLPAREHFYMPLGLCQRAPSRAPIWVDFFIHHRRRRKTAENLRATRVWGGFPPLRGGG
jgi:hypothetical protein